VKLDVDGDLQVRGEIVADSDGDTAVIVDSGTGGSIEESSLELSDRGTPKWVWVKTDTNNLLLRDSATGTNPIQIDAGAGNNTLRISAAGLVGIGKVPTTELDVLGTLTCTGFATGTGTFSGNITSFGTISAPFVTVTAALNMSGANVVLNNSNKIIGLDTGAAQRDLAYVSGADVANFGDSALESLIHVDDSSGLQVKIGASSPVQIWHEGNMGTGSGLDADLLDGIEAANFLSFQSGQYFTADLGPFSNSPPDFLEIAHSLGSRPRLMQCFMECVVATDGYSVGDRIPVDGNSNSSEGVMTWIDGTFIGGAIRNRPDYNTRSPNHAQFNMNPTTDWHFIVSCWK
jgi:hypothetical protein